MFTRKMLKAMGIEDEKIDQIMDAHVEVVDAIKTERDEYKESADKLKGVEKELNELKTSGGDWQKKFEKEHSDFEAYKSEQTKKETAIAKSEAYKDLLSRVGVSEKRVASILKVTDLSNIDLEDGKLKDEEKLAESIKNDWSDFITSTHTEGAKTQTPPGVSGGNKMSKEEILSIKDTATRQKAIADNHELFGI